MYSWYLLPRIGVLFRRVSSLQSVLERDHCVVKAYYMNIYEHFGNLCSKIILSCSPPMELQHNNVADIA